MRVRIIRYRIVECEELRKKLLAERKLTLELAMTITRSHETSEQQAEAMNKEQSLDAVKKKKKTILKDKEKIDSCQTNRK